MLILDNAFVIGGVKGWGSGGHETHACAGQRIPTGLAVAGGG